MGKYLQTLSKVVDSLNGISLGGVNFNTFGRDSLLDFNSATMFRFSRLEDSATSFVRYCNSKELQRLVDDKVVTKSMYDDKSFRRNFDTMHNVFDSIRERYGDFYITTPDKGYFVVNGKVVDEYDLSTKSNYRLQ